MVSLLPENLKTEKIELLQNKLFLVSNKEKSFPKKKYAKKVLEDLPLIFREKGSGTRETMERFLKRNQIDISKKMELTSNEAVKQSVLAGFGCSIMPLIGIKNELQNGDLQIIPTTGLPIKSQWYLIWLKNKKHSRVASEFLNYIKREKSNIVKQKFDWYESY